MSNLIPLVLSSFILTLPLVSPDDSVITLEVDLEKFIHDGKDFRGGSCEAFSRNGCDLYFRICLDKPDGAFTGYIQDMNECAYFRKESTIIRDAPRSLTFGDEIGGIDLPIIFNISKWEGGFLLKVLVSDSDSSSWIPNTDDIIDLLERRFEFEDIPGTNGSRIVIDSSDFHGFSSGNIMTTSVSAFCPPDIYHGEDFCQVFCKEANNSQGHYKCENNGTKTCLPGWEDLDSNCLNSTDDCMSNACFPGSTCIDGHQNYTCECPPHRSGHFCEEKMITCDDNPCDTNAICAKNKTGGYVCLCKDGEEKPGCTVPVGGGGAGGGPNDIDPVGSPNTSAPEKTNLPLIIGLICGMALLLLIVIILIAILMSRRRKGKKDQSTGASVDTSTVDLQAGAAMANAGTSTFGNPLYLVSPQAENNHYAEVDYNQVKVPLPSMLPHDNYPVKSKAMEAGFSPEPDPEPVKKKIPVGGVPVYVNQAGHTPIYENQYSRSLEEGAAGGLPKGGFNPMYSDNDMFLKRNPGYFDNPTYHNSLDPDAIDPGKLKKAMMSEYEEPQFVKK